MKIVFKFFPYIADYPSKMKHAPQKGEGVFANNKWYKITEINHYIEEGVTRVYCEPNSTK